MRQEHLARTVLTIGVQRQTNYALRPMSRDQFVTMLTVDLPEAPRYFRSTRRESRRRAAAARRDSPRHQQCAAAALIAAARPFSTCARRTLRLRPHPAAVNIGLDGQFASWC